MNEGAKIKNLRARIDDQLNSIEVDLGEVEQRALRINRLFLGPSVDEKNRNEGNGKIDSPRLA